MSQSPSGRTPVLWLASTPACSCANIADFRCAERRVLGDPRRPWGVPPPPPPPPPPRPPPRQRPHHHPQTVRPRQAGKIHAHHAVSEVSLARIVDRDFHHHGTLRFR